MKILVSTHIIEAFSIREFADMYWWILTIKVILSFWVVEIWEYHFNWEYGWPTLAKFIL